MYCMHLGVLASASFASNPSLDSIVAQVISQSCFDIPYHPYQRREREAKNLIKYFY